jgi:hypothetical protein
VVDEEAPLLGAAALHLCLPALHGALAAERPYLPAADKAMAVLRAHAHLATGDDAAAGASGGWGEAEGDAEGGGGLLPLASARSLRAALLDAALVACGAPLPHPAAPPLSDPSHRANCFLAVQTLAGTGQPLSPSEWGPLLREQGLLGSENAQVRRTRAHCLPLSLSLLVEHLC